VGGHIMTGPTGTNVGDAVFVVSAKAESGLEGG
jgi:glycerate-2-kinase